MIDARLAAVHHAVGLVAEMTVVGAFALHGRGIRVGLAEEEIRLAPVEIALDFPILAPRLGDPVASGGVGGDELRIFCGRKRIGIFGDRGSRRVGRGTV